MGETIRERVCWCVREMSCDGKMLHSAGQNIHQQGHGRYSPGAGEATSTQMLPGDRKESTKRRGVSTAMGETEGWLEHAAGAAADEDPTER